MDAGTFIFTFFRKWPKFNNYALMLLVISSMKKEFDSQEIRSFAKNVIYCPLHSFSYKLFSASAKFICSLYSRFLAELV